MNLHLPSGRLLRRFSCLKLVALSLVLTLCTITIVPPAWSQETASTSSEGGSGSSAGMQAGAAVCTLLYFPFKAAFAIGGGIVGGLTYVFTGGNDTAAKSVWTTSMYGTYIITPEHLQGDRPIRFLGVSDPAEQPYPAETPYQEPVQEPIR